MASTWTSLSICRDTEYLDDAFRPKVLAVISDVNGAIAKKGFEKTIRLAVFETARSTARQKILFDQGTSKTLNSKHCKVPCRAADVVFQRYNSKTGRWDWYWPQLNSWEWKLVDSSAKAHNIDRISWDKPHLQA